MATSPANFPPENVLPIGQGLSAAILGGSSGFAPTTVLSAPTTGLYQLGLLCHFLTTDGVGTISFNLTVPHGPPPNILATFGAPLAINADQAMNSQTCWLNAGDTIAVAGVATGLGATTYNLYVLAFRIF